MTFDLGARTSEMMREIADAPEFRPSKFWEVLNAKNIEMLSTGGLDHFKRTVSQNYFNWMICSRDHPFHRYLKDGAASKSTFARWITWGQNKIAVRVTSKEGIFNLTAEQRRDYIDFVGLVWDKMREYDKLGLSRYLSEPTIGDPIRIRRGLKLLSQDLANSIVEYNAIAPYLGALDARRPAVGEIGGGYGRLAYVAASVGAVRYAIFDIPPALAVAEFYLNNIFPRKRVFNFRPFRSFDEVTEELEEADILLMTPNQMLLFPDNWFSLMLSISTLPEMSEKQANLYLSQMRRLASTAIFLKQWSNWRNEADGTHLSPDDYSPGDGWRVALNRQDPIIPDFFNQLWLRD